MKVEKISCIKCEEGVMQPTKKRIPSNPPAIIFECDNCDWRQGYKVIG